MRAFGVVECEERESEMVEVRIAIDSEIPLVGRIM